MRSSGFDSYPSSLCYTAVCLVMAGLKRRKLVLVCEIDSSVGCVEGEGGEMVGANGMAAWLLADKLQRQAQKAGLLQRSPSCIISCING